MTKLTFNWTRFRNYAHWDLIINSRFYNRMCLLILGSIMTIILATYLVFPAFRGFHFNETETDPIVQISGFMLCLMAFYSVIAMAYTFHSLLTKQSRTMELSVPASTIERFVWHSLTVTIGTQVALCVSVALADLVHLALASMYGLKEIHSMWVTLYVYSLLNIGEAYKFIVDISGMQVCIMFQLSIVSEMTFLMMISAWKYRYSVMYALIVKVIIGLVEAFVLGCAFHAGAEGIIALFKDHLFGTMNVLIGLQVVIIVAEVFAAYWLFSRAQVVSRSNP